MFPAIVHRGPHAFGWMSYNPANGITVEKFEGRVSDRDNIAKVQLDDECRWFVGHVRFATHGSPKYHGNNHPLIHGSIVGVHNGVLSDWEPILAATGREDDKTEVDSEAIFAAVNKWGIKAGLARIHGNMVTVFARTNHPQVLHIARSHGRPLVYCMTPAGSLVFASECCVIDECRIEHDEYVEMTGVNRRLEVEAGVIKVREQYRTPPSASKRTLPARPRPVPLSIEQGGVSGITDYFDRGRAPKRRQGATSLDPRPQGTVEGSGDEWGGEYIGAGWYRNGNGRIMAVHEYVKWAVKAELKRLEQLAAADAAADFESIIHAEETGQVSE
jgi:hypothetical protein